MKGWGISETEDNSEENGHTLGVVDGSVNKENLAEVVPDNAALTHSSDNGGKVIVSEDHLGYDYVENTKLFFFNKNTTINNGS